MYIYTNTHVCVRVCVCVCTHIYIYIELTRSFSDPGAASAMLGELHSTRKGDLVLANATLVPDRSLFNYEPTPPLFAPAVIPAMLRPCLKNFSLQDKVSSHPTAPPSLPPSPAARMNPDGTERPSGLRIDSKSGWATTRYLCIDIGIDLHISIKVYTCRHR